MSEERPAGAGHYGAYYRDFAAEVYSEIRREEFGEDLGQNNWQTRGRARELRVPAGARSPESTCWTSPAAPAGPGCTSRGVSGCELTGVDREQGGLANARRIAQGDRPRGAGALRAADASLPLPFAEGSFDAILCLDALNHLPGRAGVFADWARLLVPGGRLLVTDPVTITGLVVERGARGPELDRLLRLRPAGRGRAPARRRRPRGQGRRRPHRDRRRRRAPSLHRARRARGGAPGDRGRRGLRAPPALHRHRRDARAGAAHLALRLPRGEAALNALGASA